MRRAKVGSVLGASLLLAAGWLVASPSVDAAHALGGCNYVKNADSPSKVEATAISCSSDSAIQARMGHYANDSTTRVSYSYGAKVWTSGAHTSATRPSGSFWESNAILTIAR
jgi:hypothetical protein